MKGSGKESDETVSSQPKMKPDSLKAGSVSEPTSSQYVWRPTEALTGSQTSLLGV